METRTEPFTLSPELTAEIERVCTEYDGQLDDLYQSIGLLVAGQLFGWRVMRLVAQRQNWRDATHLFGDLKERMPERGDLWYRSVGLKLADDLQDYWNIIKGVVKIPHEQRRATVDR